MTPDDCAQFVDSVWAEADRLRHHFPALADGLIAAMDGLFPALDSTVSAVGLLVTWTRLG